MRCFILLLFFAVFALSARPTHAAISWEEVARVVRPDASKLGPLECPCQNPQWCESITTPDRPEAFIFQTDSSFASWSNYDWDVITTVVLFGDFNQDLLCYAHSRGIRVTLLANYPKDQLTNATARTEWVNQQVNAVQNAWADGINVDFESPIDSGSPEVDAYTQLIKELTTSMHASVAGSQVTVDVAWSPDCIDGRCFDYYGIAMASDFLFTMNYDEQSQIFPPRLCVAGANDPLPWQEPALQAYLALGIPASKLVLGVPWYGYDYPCLSAPVGDTKHCPIKAVPFRGAPCSDAAGSEVGYGDLMKILWNNATAEGARWDSDSSSWYFHYTSTVDGQLHEMWFDDPLSLSLRYQLAKKLGLRGVGMWNVDLLDYSSNPLARWQTAQMWGSLALFFSNSTSVDESLYEATAFAPLTPLRA